MIDVKQAVEIAKTQAAEVMGKPTVGLEEIERERYKGREVWSITLSVPRDVDIPLARIGAIDRYQFKRFLIDATTGELVAIKLRELAMP